MTLETSTDDLRLADLGERIVGAGVVVERERALVGDVVVGVEPVLAQDDRIGRDAAHLLDEAREMPGDLRVGRPVVGGRRRDRLRLAELVDLHHPGRDRAARRLPDEAAGEAAAQRERCRRKRAASSSPGRGPSRCARPRPGRRADRASRARASCRSGRWVVGTWIIPLRRDRRPPPLAADRRSGRRGRRRRRRG